MNANMVSLQIDRSGTTKKRIYCDECGMNDSNKKALKIHEKIVHSYEKRPEVFKGQEEMRSMSILSQ